MILTQQEEKTKDASLLSVSKEADYQSQEVPPPSARRRLPGVWNLVVLLASLGIVGSVLHQTSLNELKTCTWTFPLRVSCRPAGWTEAGGQRQSVSRPAHTDDAQAIPDYVLEYAPLVYLADNEAFWPGDMSEHLQHVEPMVNYESIDLHGQTINMSNLAQLNDYAKGWNVFLTSDDDPESRPDWLTGEPNVPSSGHGTTSSSSVRCSRAFRPVKGGRSRAPAVLVLIDKDDGVQDAFWFFFYSFNEGARVLKVRWGNHVGDWEHTLVRFQHGRPKAVFLSEHSWGSAYTYRAMNKIGKRPIVYSAVGTHAMYATPGLHPYVLPLGLLHDETSDGPLWDPAQNLYAYAYDPVADHLQPLASNTTTIAAATTTSSSSSGVSSLATSWFHFRGHWGDKLYPMADKRQYGWAGEYHYVNGPTGPKFKHLSRRHVCQGREAEPCEIQRSLASDTALKNIVGDRDGEGDA